MQAPGATPVIRPSFETVAPLSSEELRSFLWEYEAALTASGLSEYFTLGRLKELWFYMQALFPDGGRALKRLQKARTLSEFREAERVLFDGGSFDSGAQG